jgi:Leucine-rich repeat (LRR) protein
MLRHLWIALYVIIIAMLPTRSWALCYYLVDQEGNVQSSIYPPYDLSYPSDQLPPAERARRAQLGHLIIGARVPTCSNQPFSPPKIAKAQPIDSNKKIDNTTTTQNAPPLKKPLTPTEIQEATKANATVATKTEENQQITTRPASKPLPKVEEPPKETKKPEVAKEETAQPIKTPPAKEKPVENQQTAIAPVTQAKEPPLAATKETIKETVQEKTEKPVEKLAEKSVEKSIQITENMTLQTIQSIDDSLSKRDLTAYRKLLAPSLEVGELKGGGKSKMQKLTAEAYSKQLEQALSKIARYELKHIDPKITIDNEKSQATVNSEVHVHLEFQDALETSKTYGEITTFSLVDEKLLLSRLAVIANTSKSTPQTAPATSEQVQANQPVDPCKGISEIPETECQSLVELYETTGGEKWKNKKNWLKTKQPCQWNGVTCVNNHVVTLKLDKNQLSGSMPNLSGLTALKILNLSRNDLSGGLPSFNALLELEVLSLGNNKLNGRLPELSHLKMLRILELNKNQLTGNLPILDSFVELEEINLSDNQFVGDLPSLKKMNKLQKLAIYNNQLTGNLPALDQLVSLKSMHLSGNHLTGQIPDLSNLLQLESLNLSVNQLSGNLPIGLSKLANLKWLQLESNQLSGKIPDLRDLPKLSILKLQNNQLCGEIPEGLRLSGLKEANSELQIENNHLTATNKGLLSFLESKAPNWQTTQKPQACE